LVELLEAKNHQTALQERFDHVSTGQPVNQAFILKLHAILMNGLRPDAGWYRDHGVRIVGTNVPTANAASVPRLMKELLETPELPYANTVSKSSILSLTTSETRKSDARFGRANQANQGD
jgi:Fic family protein